MQTSIFGKHQLIICLGYVRDENGIYSTNAALYGVQNLPAFFLINRNNELRARGETVKDLEGTIKSML